MKKHVLFLFTLFVGASMAMGQMQVTSPYSAGLAAFEWSGKDYQRGATVVFEGTYESEFVDSTQVSVMRLDAVSWAGVLVHTIFSDGVNGQAIDGIVQDTLVIPEDFDLTVDAPADHFLLQARVWFQASTGYDGYANAAINVVEAYTDSVAIDTIHYQADWTALGQINLGETITVEGRYGVADIESVQITLMHLNSAWGTVKEDILDVYNPANGVGHNSGKFHADYMVPEDFNTTEDLADGDFFTLRTFAKYKDGTNKFLFSWLNVVDLAVGGVELSESTINLEVGASQLLTATVSPSTAEDKSLTWSSSNEDIAFVEQSGLVSGMSNGVATITVTTTDGGFTSTCDVTVGTGAVEMNGLGAINVYPNPASDHLNIEGLSAGNYSVAVYSVHGAMMKTVEIDGAGMNSLSIEELPQGIYFLDIKGDEGRSIQKISKR